MGRPTKLTDKVRKDILEVIGAGGSITHAAKWSGVSRQTIHDWLSLGKRANRGIYREFYDDFRRAEARPEIIAMSIVQRAIRDGDLKACQWYLERRAGWNGREETPVQITISHDQLSVNQLLIEAASASKSLETLSPPIIDLDEE